MVVHKVFGVERNIDVPSETFAMKEFEYLENEVNQSVPCQHGWFQSCYQGAKLHYRMWLPRDEQGKVITKPKAILIYNHGITAHSGISLVIDQSTQRPKRDRVYNAALMVEHFVKREQCALYSFDYYGHGYSEGCRFLIPETWENNRNDCIAFCKLVSQSLHKDDMDIPLILLGESYGGCLTLHVARYFQDNPDQAPLNLDSVVLLAPAIVGDFPPYPVYAVLRYFLAPLFPKRTPPFMPHPISPDRVWRDPDVLKTRTSDRYIQMRMEGGGPVCLGTALGLALALENVVDSVIPGFRIPYCILHGEHDEAVLPKGSEYLWNQTLESVQETDREFHKIPHGRHCLMSDPDAEQHIQRIVSWIQKRIQLKTMLREWTST